MWASAGRGSAGRGRESSTEIVVKKFAGKKRNKTAKSSHDDILPACEAVRLPACLCIVQKGKAGKAQSTYIYRAPQCMSPRRNWDSPNPFAASECALPPGPKGGGAHPPAPKGVGEFQFRRWRKSLALCLLCVLDYLFNSKTT
jgi:hypothetical protein